MKIRGVEKRDVKQLVKLCELHAVFENAKYNSKNKEALLLEHFFEKDANIQCLVVELSDEIIGYATFIKQFSTWDAVYYLYLDCLFLKEIVRGQGIGFQLMQKIKEYAQSQNCVQIQWQTPDFNTSAILFYEKLGAVSKTKERFSWEV